MRRTFRKRSAPTPSTHPACVRGQRARAPRSVGFARGSDRKSTRLNSSRGYISYAVFCLKKKNNEPKGFGQVVGLDISDEIVRQAREASKDFENILYVCGSAQQIPWEDFFFNDTATTEIYTLSLHDALPI